MFLAEAIHLSVKHSSHWSRIRCSLTNLTVHVQSVMQTAANITPHTSNCRLGLLYSTQNCLDPTTDHTMHTQRCLHK